MKASQAREAERQARSRNNRILALTAEVRAQRERHRAEIAAAREHYRPLFDELRRVRAHIMGFDAEPGGRAA